MVNLPGTFCGLTDGGLDCYIGGVQSCVSASGQAPRQFRSRADLEAVVRHCDGASRRRLDTSNRWLDKDRLLVSER